MSRLVPTVIVLLAVGRPAGAGPAVADLFPPDTLAYAELREPAKLGPQVTAALAGSPLEDVVKLIDARRDAAKTPQDAAGKPLLAVLGLVASPEMAAEFGRLGGVAAGLTGFNATGDPEGAVAVLTGDSAAAGLAARGFLAMAPVRRVGAVDGVPVYQFRTPRFSFDPNTGQQKLDNDKPPEEGAYEATAAFTPGLFVYGTSKTAVAGVLARFRGKGGNALAGVDRFTAARAARPHPGLFVYADAAALVAKLDAARREADGGPEPDALGWFRLLANDKAVGHVAGTVRFRDGGLAAELSATFAPTPVSPLLTLLSGPGVKPEFLGHAPASAGYGVTLTIPEKGGAAAVIGFLDAAAKAAGGLGRTPGEAVKELEAKFKTPLADGLIGKTRAVTVFAPSRPAGAKDAHPLPTVVLHADTPEVAAAWEEFLPKLAADLAGGEPVRPSSEQINGVKVLSLPGADLPGKAAVHYARKDGAVAVGLDRSVVAAAVAGGAPGPTLPADGPLPFAGTVRIGSALRGWLDSMPPAGPVVPVPAGPPPVRPGSGPPGGPVVPPEAQQKTEAKALASVWAALDNLPPAVVTARRTGNEMRVELVQPVGKSGLAPVVTAAVGWFEAYLGRNPNQPGGISGSYPRFR